MAKKQSALTNIIENGKPKLTSSNVFTDEYKIKLDNITTPMQIVGRVDDVDDLPTENVKKGDTYLVGAEGSEQFDEYVCIDDIEVTWENVGPVQKEELFERGEGVSSINAKGFGSYTEARRSVNVGYLNTINATAPESFAEGARNTIGNADDSGDCHESHVEGGGNQILDGAYGSHAEGFLNTIEDGAYGSHAEGHGNIISGGTQYSHAEGIYNKISEGAYASHVEGINNEIKGSAIATIVTGQQNTVDSYSSAVHGIGNEINGYVNFVFGTYNKTYKSTVSQQGYTTTYSSNNNIISGISNTVYGEIQSSILAGSNNNVYCIGRHAYNLFISGQTDFYPNGDGTFSLLTAESRNRNSVYGHNGFFHGDTIKITSTGGFNNVLNTYSSQIKDAVQFSNILGSASGVISGSCEYSNILNSTNSNIEAAVKFSSIIVSTSSHIDSGSHYFNLILGSNNCNIKNISNYNFHSIISSDSSNITDGAGQFNTILGGSNHKIDSGASNAVIIYGNCNRINNGVDISGIFLGNHNLITNGSHRSLIFGGATNQITNAACDSIIINAFSSEISTSTLNFLSGNSNIIRGNYPSKLDASNFIFGDYNKIEPLNGSTVGHNVVFASGWISSGKYRNIINGSYNFLNGFAIATNESDWSTVLTSNFIDIYQKCNYSTFISATNSYIGDTLDTYHPGNYFQFNAIVSSSFCVVSGETMYSNILNSSSSKIKGYYYKEEDLNNSSYYSQFNSILTGCSNEIDLSEWKKSWGGTDAGFNTILGGTSNKIKNAGTSTIINGYTNNIADGVCYSAIINGCFNTINNGSQNNIILSGINNIITNGSYRSAIIAGYGNHIGENTINSVVLGACNYLSGSTRSSFIEGEDNYISGSTRNLHIEGVGHKSIYTSFSHIEGVGGLRLQFKEYDVNNKVYEIEFYDSSNSDITMDSYEYLIREGMYIAIGRTSVINPGSNNAVKIETQPSWRSESQRSFYTVQLSEEIDVTKEWCLLEACTAYASHIEGVSNVNYGKISHIEGQGNYNTAFLGHVGGQNNINYGELGVVYGCKNTNTSQMSTIFGSHNYVGGQYSLVVGCKNTTNYEAQYVFGIENTLSTSANYQFLFGTKNTVTGSCHNLTVFGVGLEINNAAYSFIWGDGNASGGDYIKDVSFSSIMGVFHTVENTSYSNVFGSNNTVGDSSKSVHLTTVFGTANTVKSSYSFVHGTDNIVTDARLAVVFGDDNVAENAPQRQIMFGCGNVSSNVSNIGAATNIFLGEDNKISSSTAASVLIGGKKNEINNGYVDSSIIYGCENTISAAYESAVFGCGNKLNGTTMHSIVAGAKNTVSNTYYSIINSCSTISPSTAFSLLLLFSSGDETYGTISGVQSSILAGNIKTTGSAYIESSINLGYNNTISKRLAFSSIIGSGNYCRLEGTMVSGFDLNNRNGYLAENWENSIISKSIIAGNEIEVCQTYNTSTSNPSYFNGLAIFGCENVVKDTVAPARGEMPRGNLLISGYYNRVSSSRTSSISGSCNILNKGSQCIVSGDNNNVSYEATSSIISGSHNKVNGYFNISFITGNENEILTDGTSNESVIFGSQNKIKYASQSLVLGVDNVEDNLQSTIVSGFHNKFDSNYSNTSLKCSVVYGNANTYRGEVVGVLMGGYANSITNSNNSIITGDRNNILGYCNESVIVGYMNRFAKDGGEVSISNTIVTGSYVVIKDSSYASAIFGHSHTITKINDSLVLGIANEVDDATNSLIYGTDNDVKGTTTLITICGIHNEITDSSNSHIIGGSGNSISNYDNVVMINCNDKVAEKSDVTYIRNIDTNEVVTDKKYTNVIISDDDNVAPTLEELTEMLIVNLTSNMTVVTLPTMPNNKSITINVKVIQDNIGNRDLMFESEDFAPINNPDNIDFTIGNALERCMVTLIWDSEEWWLSSTKYVQAQGTPF